MCVAAIAWNAHPDWLLVCAGNRDEWHARPAAPLARWDDGSGIISGKDLTGGGTWLGLTENGRFALVTNFRTPEGAIPGRPSRGRLVTDLLAGIVLHDAARMNPFNLIFVDRGSARFLTNRPQFEQRDLACGIHGLSNGGFDVPWPKTKRVEGAIADWMQAGGTDIAVLLDTLRDESIPPETTSSESAPEHRFAPVFIRNPEYGTRCSTVIAIRKDGRGIITERSFSATAAVIGEHTETFHWPLA